MASSTAAESARRRLRPAGKYGRTRTIAQWTRLSTKSSVSCKYLFYRQSVCFSSHASAVSNEVCAFRRCGLTSPQWRHCRSVDRQRRDNLSRNGTSPALKSGFLGGTYCEVKEFRQNRRGPPVDGEGAGESGAEWTMTLALRIILFAQFLKPTFRRLARAAARTADLLRGESNP